MTTETGIFVSYARTDKTTAKQVVESLRVSGLQVWWDEDIPDNRQWQQVLADKVNACSAFLLLIGQQGVSGWVRAEVGIAMNRHFSRQASTDAPDKKPLPIVPILLGNASVDLIPPFLELFQFSNLSLPVSNEAAAELVGKLQDEVFDDYCQTGIPPELGNCPFPGLAPFTQAHRALFFGRHRDTFNALDSFQRRHSGGQRIRWLRIEGNSGVGKSSLLYAGLLPAIENGWLELGAADTQVRLLGVMRPGNTPLRNLALTLAKAFGQHSEDLEQRLHKDNFTLAHLFGEELSGAHNELPLLIVDQFEELFSLAPTSERERFDQLLSNALTDHNQPLYLITTMRSDFLGQFDQAPLLNAQRDQTGRFELLTVGPAGISDIVRRSTQLAGLSFSDEDLADDIIAEARKEPSALPLVSNLLRLLCDKATDDPALDSKVLQRADYKALGGIAGAIAESANRLLDSLEDQKSTFDLLLELVKPGSETAHARRQISWEAAVACAGGGEQAINLIRRLSGQAVDGANLAEHEAVRLILLPTETDETGAVKTRVDLIHETLLRTRPDGEAYWPKFWEEIKRRDDFLATRTRLEAQAQAWDKHKDDSMLAQGRDLELFLSHLKTAEGDTKRFLDTSIKQDKTKKRIRSLIYLLIFGVSLSGAFYIHGNLWREKTGNEHWQNYLDMWSEWLDRSPIDLELVKIEPGCFMMGAERDDKGEEECFEKAFHIGKFEVTFAKYDRFALSTDRKLPDDEGWGRDKQPVINVDWYDAYEFARSLSQKDGVQCRLPKEEEWEYAARAGTTTEYALPAKDGGSDDIEGQGLANCRGCGSEWDGKQTAPVGSFDPNAWDLYDMHGNVFEWCLNKSREPTVTKTDDSGDYRVLRGGSWYFYPDDARSANRLRVNPDLQYFGVGFRVLCSGPLTNH